MELNDLNLFVHDNRHFIDLCEEYGWDQPEEVIDYGEGWEAMATHVSDMGMLDRLIFQECQVSGGKVVAPHPNIEAPHPFWLGPRWISRKCKCSVKDATILADCWAILDASRDMVDEFIGWLNQDGKFPAGLRYFEKLTFWVAEAEASDPDDILNTDFTAFHEVETIYEDDGEVTWEQTNLLGCETVQPEEQADGSPVAFHIIGAYGKESDPWLSKQPYNFKTFIHSIESTASLKELGEVGKRVYKTNGFNRPQAGVFWTYYGLRKIALKNKRN